MKTTKMRPPLKTVLAVGTALLCLTYSKAFSQTSHSPGLPQDVETALENAETFTLFSIEPVPDFQHKATNTFQGHAILGQLDVQSKETRTELIDALNKGISAGENPLAPVGADLHSCFDPRHAIRAKKGNETVELFISFECNQIYITYITSRSGTNQLFMTSGDPAETFNKVLKDAGVPVAAAQTRVYYVGGQVAHPGPEEYLGDTTVTRAIQAAGDFTPFASHKVWLDRADGTRIRVNVDKALRDANQDPPVFAGDQINVPRRIF